MAKNELSFPGSDNKPEKKSETGLAAKTGSSLSPEVKKAENKLSASVKEESNKVSTEVKSGKNELSDSTRPFNAGTVAKKTSGVDDDYLTKKRNKKKKRNKILLWIGAGLLGLIIGVVGFLFWYKHYLFSKVTFIPQQEVTIVNDEGETVDVKKLREQFKPEIPVIESEDIKNFLVITYNEYLGLS